MSKSSIKAVATSAFAALGLAAMSAATLAIGALLATTVSSSAVEEKPTSGLHDTLKTHVRTKARDDTNPNKPKRESSETQSNEKAGKTDGGPGHTILLK